MNDNPLILNTALVEALNVIGDRWSLLILRDLFLGVRRFEQLRKRTGASRATLTRRLESLVSNDILYKRVYSSTGKRFEYRLTEKGVGLFPVALLAWQWEYEWVDQTGGALPKVLVHSGCRQPLTPRAVCQRCKQPIRIGDVEWPELSDALKQQFSAIVRTQKQRRVRSTAKKGEEDLSLVHVSGLIGDRWTLLILIASFLGENRYDGFQKQLGIAPNILSSRLKLMLDVAVFTRVDYQDNPPRGDYRLTDKGRGLYALVMAMRQWAIDWVNEGGAGERLIHRPCQMLLVVDVQCGGCSEKPWPRDVEFNRQK